MSLEGLLLRWLQMLDLYSAVFADPAERQAVAIIQAVRNCPIKDVLPATEANCTSPDTLRILLDVILVKDWKALDHEDFDRLAYLARDTFGENSLEECVVLAKTASHLTRARELDAALRMLAKCETFCREPVSMYAEYATCLCLTQLARVEMYVGDLEEAKKHIAEAEFAGRPWEFAAHSIAHYFLAELHWREGVRDKNVEQLKRALGMHRDGRMRQILAERGFLDRLVGSHNSAAKVAMEVGLLEIAEQELESGRSLAKIHPQVTKTRQGWTYLYCGDLAQIQGRPEVAARWYSQARRVLLADERVHYYSLQIAEQKLLGVGVLVENPVSDYSE